MLVGGLTFVLIGLKHQFRRLFPSCSDLPKRFRQIVNQHRVAMTNQCLQRFYAPGRPHLPQDSACMPFRIRVFLLQ